MFMSSYAIPILAQKYDTQLIPAKISALGNSSFNFFAPLKNDVSPEKSITAFSHLFSSKIFLILSVSYSKKTFFSLTYGSATRFAPIIISAFFIFSSDSESGFDFSINSITFSFELSFMTFFISEISTSDFSIVLRAMDALSLAVFNIQSNIFPAPTISL